MSYQRERDAFIDRMSSEGLPLSVTERLLRAATTLNRYAELACSSEAADRDRVPCPASPTKTIKVRGTVKQIPRKPTGPCVCDGYTSDGTLDREHLDVPRITVQADRLERRIAELLPAGWIMDTQGDPRGYVLRVIPPSYAERNKDRDKFNRDTIGVPSGPSGLRF